MRDWLLMTLPIAVAIYLFLNPAQLADLLSWMQGVLN